MLVLIQKKPYDIAYNGNLFSFPLETVIFINNHII